MLSILVCHSYYLRLDQKQVLRAKPYPPLATLQVVALLRKAGHRVTFFDAMLADGIDEYERLLQADRPQLVLFYEDNFNFLSKMCLGTMRRAACDMIVSARRAGARVISAGPDVTDAPGPYLRAGADVALIGEGLSALLQIIPRLDGAPDADSADLVRGLAGIASLNGGQVSTGSGSKAMPLAPDVGLAAWDLVDMERYRAVWLKAHGHFSLNMAASRGCPFRCAWCAKPIWGNQYLQRDAAEVAAEMAYLKRSFNPDHIWFADDIFGFRVDWVAKFAASVQAAGAKIPFTIQTRADLVSQRMAEALRDAGCREVWLGAESGSQRVLDAMNKGTTVTEIEVARARLKAVGIRVGFFIQLGYMGEQLSDILATRNLLDATRPDEIGVSVSYPLPGTKFYELVKAQLGGKTHWQESNDLEMMFQGTYTSDFYRAIRNLLHDQIDCQTANSSTRELESNWRELLSRENQFRSDRAQSRGLNGASSASPAAISGQPRILADGVPFAVRNP
jgi:anaerobic magnesium-protoporphyrin IX monomethyl ester cyclase